MDAAEILALPLQAEHEGLKVALRTWPAEVGERAQDAADAGAGQAEVMKIIGTPESVVLSGDGRAVYADKTCDTTAHPRRQLVPFEHWTGEGLVSRGRACPRDFCRGVVRRD
ncbi:hypothetical protein [Actinomadura nitritigenes]|uniref:hypothetical protein n=1 Tax=Actinomadura nitritigenes TaxID=134602 RepID=UPI003D8A1E24